MRLLVGERVGWAEGDSDRVGVGVGRTLVAEHAARHKTVRVPTIAKLSRRAMNNLQHRQRSHDAGQARNLTCGRGVPIRSNAHPGRLSKLLTILVKEPPPVSKGPRD